MTSLHQDERQQSHDMSDPEIPRPDGDNQQNHDMAEHQLYDPTDVDSPTSLDPGSAMTVGSMPGGEHPNGREHPNGHGHPLGMDDAVGRESGRSLSQEHDEDENRDEDADERRHRYGVHGGYVARRPIYYGDLVLSVTAPAHYAYLFRVIDPVDYGLVPVVGRLLTQLHLPELHIPPDFHLMDQARQQHVLERLHRISEIPVDSVVHHEDAGLILITEEVKQLLGMPPEPHQHPPTTASAPMLWHPPGLSP